jgi:hypothetical protein
MESLKNDVEAFKKKAAENEQAKEQEVRTLQNTMGTMRAKNAILTEENDSKPSLLNLHYRGVLEGTLSTRLLLNLNQTPPFEIALEGTLVILATMYCTPVELASATNTIDLWQRPIENKVLGSS